MTILLAHRKGKTEVNFSGRQQKIIFRLFKMYKPQTKGNIHISVFPIQSECCHTRLSHDSSCEPVGRKMLRKCHCLIYLCTPAFWFQSSFSVPDCCCYHKSTLDHLKINIPHIWIMDFSVCLIQKGKKKKKSILLLLLRLISPSNWASQLMKNLAALSHDPCTEPCRPSTESHGGHSIPSTSHTTEVKARSGLTHRAPKSQKHSIGRQITIFKVIL